MAAGILSAQEGRFEDGKWIPGRRLNGDAIMVSSAFSENFKHGSSDNGLEFDESMNIQRVELYQY